MKCVPEENDPFNFEGPEIYKCKVKYYFKSYWLDFVPMEIFSYFHILSFIFHGENNKSAT